MPRYILFGAFLIGLLAIAHAGMAVLDIQVVWNHRPVLSALVLSSKSNIILLITQQINPHATVVGFEGQH